MRLCYGACPTKAGLRLKKKILIIFMPEEQKTAISSEEAQKVLEQEKEARIKQCGEEIQASLAKHNCSLTAVIMVAQNGNFPQISIISK